MVMFDASDGCLTAALCAEKENPSNALRPIEGGQVRGSCVRQSRPTVLVVEDEPLMRMHAVSLVADAGFDTLEASNADEAIAILEARKDIRVVFTDINMPGSMDGLRLAHAIRRRWPPIELILTSGDFQVDEDELPRRGRFLPKPYAAAEVISALNDLAG